MSITCNSVERLKLLCTSCKLLNKQMGDIVRAIFIDDCSWKSSKVFRAVSICDCLKCLQCSAIHLYNVCYMLLKIYPDEM